MPDYAITRDRVEEYFDRTATTAWARLTTDAKVSRIRQTVRAGRDRMRATMLARLPEDLTGMRVLDAGCGTGAMTVELAQRGAQVLAVDISPQLVRIAQDRLPDTLRGNVRFHAGDMTDEAHGAFDFVVAMDSMIYYTAPDIAAILARMAPRTDQAIVFTLAPRTALLMAFWGLGKLFPRSDRSPVMVPHALPALRAHVGSGLDRVARISSGFYISECLEYRP